MIGVLGLAELEELLSILHGARSDVETLGSPTRIAGDPSTITDLADAHRHVATTLRTMLEDVQTRSLSVIDGGQWEGTASAAYAQYWSRVHGSIGDLASRHDRIATSLDSVAAQTARLNAQAAMRLDTLNQWLGLASAAVLRPDAGEIITLLEHGRNLLSDWKRLIGELEAHAAWTRDQLSADLSFSGGAIMSSFSPRSVIVPPLSLPPLPWSGVAVSTPDRVDQDRVDKGWMAVGGAVAAAHGGELLGIGIAAGPFGIPADVAGVGFLALGGFLLWQAH